jgi:phosphoglucomutase/phosphopentomutase
MQFGTAGLRGLMGPGYCNMNDLVVIQTTQGFVSYLEKALGPNAVQRLQKDGVVIGYDGRHNSKR